MNQAAYEEFVIPMRRLFSPPPHLKGGGEDDALKEYLSSLERFPAQALKRGWQIVKEKHKTAFWPPVAICVSACAQSRNDTSEESTGNSKGRIVDGEWQPWGGACNCSRCRPHKQLTEMEREMRDQAQMPGEWNLDG